MIHAHTSKQEHVNKKYERWNTNFTDIKSVIDVAHIS